MPYSESRRARERRLRAKYRKKMTVTSIITLVIGLIVGFVLCVVSVNKVGSISRLLKIGPVTDNVSVQAMAVPTSEPGADGGDVLAFNKPDAEPADLSNLGAPVVNPEDSGDVFGAAGDNAPQSFEAEPEGNFTDPQRAGDDASANNYGADAGVEIVLVNTPEPVVETSVPEPVATPEPTQEPTAEPTQEPTPEPTAEPTPEPTPAETPEPVIVPYGQFQTIETEINEDGSRRTEASDEPYEALSLTLHVEAYKDPAYFQDQYATQYKLQGDEAAVEFGVTLNNYTGTTEILPQNVLLITFVGEDPSIVVPGYQLMDAEIAGKTEIAISSDVNTMLFKRYPYSAEQGDMVYMSVTTCNDGVENVYWFEVLEPEVEPEEGEGGEDADENDSSAKDGITLQKGDSGDEVIKLQRALINLGLLKGVPDGKYGNYTVEAVKTMQGRYGMEKTGIADQAFLDRLYGVTDSEDED